MKDYDLREIFQSMEIHLISALKRTFSRHKKEEIKEGFEWEQWQLTKLKNIEKYRKENQKIIEEYSDPIQEAIDTVLNDSFKAGEKRVEKVVEQVQKKNPEIILPKNIRPPKPVKINKEPPVKSKIEPISDVLPRVMPKKVVPKIEPKKEDIKPLLLSAPKPKVEPAENKIKEPIVSTSENDNFFGVNDKKLKALTDSVKNDIEVAQQSVLRKMDDVYRQTIFKAHVFLQSGSSTLYQAVDMATKDFLDKGINSIQYKDGKRVNIASYAEMALRTASQRATFMGEGKKRDEFGIHTVVVSAHANTCPLCLPWQGKVLIDDVYSNGSKADGKYPLVSKAMKEGLFHPNCRHTLITYFPGITHLPKVPKEDTINKNYEAEQKQRYMERQIRKYKRIEAGELDPANTQKASGKVKEWQERLRQHLKDNPQLRRDNWREQPKINSPTSKNIKGLNQLGGTVTKDNIKVNAPTKHLIERAAERGVNKESIEDALKSPLKIGNIRVDKDGRKSKIYIGEKATVAINPDNGNIITTYRTSSQRVRRLKGENKTE